MSTLLITDPQSNQQVSAEIHMEERHDRQQSWRIRFQDGRNVLVGLDQHGIWQQLEGDDLDPKLVLHIGQAIDKQQSSS